MTGVVLGGMSIALYDIIYEAIFNEVSTVANFLIIIRFITFNEKFK